MAQVERDDEQQEQADHSGQPPQPSSLEQALLVPQEAAHYLAKKESIILIGNPGLGKTHVATGLALAACQQGKKVRFFTAAGLVNESTSCTA
jgi:DNA replication protein DnaC